MIERGESNYLFVTENYRTENPNITQLRITLTVFCLISTGYPHILIFSKRKLKQQVLSLVSRGSKPDYDQKWSSGKPTGQ